MIEDVGDRLRYRSRKEQETLFAYTSPASSEFGMKVIAMEIKARCLPRKMRAPTCVSAARETSHVFVAARRGPPLAPPPFSRDTLGPRWNRILCG